MFHSGVALLAQQRIDAGDRALHAVIGPTGGVKNVSIPTCSAIASLPTCSNPAPTSTPSRSGLAITILKKPLAIATSRNGKHATPSPLDALVLKKGRSSREE
jgi:hypothetical protein